MTQPTRDEQRRRAVFQALGSSRFPGIVGGCTPLGQSTAVCCKIARRGFGQSVSWATATAVIQVRPHRVVEGAGQGSNLLSHVLRTGSRAMSYLVKVPDEGLARDFLRVYRSTTAPQQVRWRESNPHDLAITSFMDSDEQSGTCFQKTDEVVTRVLRRSTTELRRVEKRLRRRDSNPRPPAPKACTPIGSRSFISTADEE